MLDDCVFCRIVKGILPCSKIYEDDRVLAFLDTGPISDGHCLIIPKAHYDRIETCPSDLVADIVRQAGRIAQAIIKAVEAEDYNFLSNNGPSAGQVVHHLHFHIIPRRPGDEVFNRWPAKKYPPGTIEELNQKIRQHL